MKCKHGGILKRTQELRTKEQWPVEVTKQKINYWASFPRLGMWAQLITLHHKPVKSNGVVLLLPQKICYFSINRFLKLFFVKFSGTSQFLGCFSPQIYFYKKHL